MTQRRTDSCWAVVKVESGIPAMVSLFVDETMARKREQFLRADMNPEDDETGVLEVRIMDTLSVEPDLADQ